MKIIISHFFVILIATILLASCSKDQVTSIQPLAGIRLEVADQPTKAHLPDAFDALVDIYIGEELHSSQGLGFKKEGEYFYSVGHLEAPIDTPLRIVVSMHVEGRNWLGESGNITLGKERASFFVDITIGLAGPFTLSLVADPRIGGVVSGGGEYEAGYEVNLSASAAEGWEFVMWMDQDQELVSPDANFVLVMPAQDYTITGFFQLTDLGDPMLLVYDTSLGDDNTVTLPLSEVTNVKVDWGDGHGQTILTSGLHHYTYEEEGSYTVSIRGSLGQFGASGWEGYSNAEKLTRVISFGDLELTSLAGAFNGASNLTEVPAQLPEGIINTSAMFNGASLFNQDISRWDVSQVFNMRGMFLSTDRFNQDISGWDVSSVTDMGYMFYSATAFNQDLANWDVSSVSNMSHMFGFAENFKHSIGAWDVGNVADMENMFYEIRLPTSVYDHLLIGWSALDLQRGVNFHGGSSQYSEGRAAEARHSIVENFEWVITDGGISEGPSQ